MKRCMMGMPSFGFATKKGTADAQGNNHFFTAIWIPLLSDNTTVSPYRTCVIILYIYMYLWEETPNTSLAQPVSSPIHRQPWLQRLTSEHRLFAEEGSGSASTARDEFLLAVDAPIFYPPPANMGRRKATKLDKELIIISNMRNNIVSKQHKKPRRNT